MNGFENINQYELSMINGGADFNAIGLAIAAGGGILLGTKIGSMISPGAGSIIGGVVGGIVGTVIYVIND